ncbi:hypothetical protein F4678DRAFT_145989 [Xylaria arbuscula]|nr:hypothetical protein F4678DRAFT_145989 [Xylaria arbuscula]
MPQIPPQIVVSLVQLTVTILQLFLMIFTWFNPRRVRPFIGQRLDRVEAAMASQQALEMLPVDDPSAHSLAEQLNPSTHQPGIIHDPALPDSSSGILANRAQHQSSPTQNDQHHEPRAIHQSMIST